jgi:hypothetical protein
MLGHMCLKSSMELEYQRQHILFGVKSSVYISALYCKNTINCEIYSYLCYFRNPMSNEQITVNVNPV